MINLLQKNNQLNWNKHQPVFLLEIPSLRVCVRVYLYPDLSSVISFSFLLMKFIPLLYYLLFVPAFWLEETSLQVHYGWPRWGGEEPSDHLLHAFISPSPPSSSIMVDGGEFWPCRHRRGSAHLRNACVCVSRCFDRLNLKVKSQLRQSRKFFNHLCNLLWSQAVWQVSAGVCACVRGKQLDVLHASLWVSDCMWTAHALPVFTKRFIWVSVWWI